MAQTFRGSGESAVRFTLRLNQAGDLVASASGRLSRAFLNGLLAVVKARRLQAWTYTHHDHTVGDNGRLLRRANREGLRINVSTETEESADRAIASGLPAVLAVSSEETRTVWRTPDRNLVRVCPAQLRDTDCNRCMLCHKRGSKVIIAFLAHGSRKSRANQQLRMKQFESVGAWIAASDSTTEALLKMLSQILRQTNLKKPAQRRQRLEEINHPPDCGVWNLTDRH